ncbi:MAG: DNA polymerase III subunit gamma/tau [Lachnospiraceae bacterium]|nr:DNA polymerase III subunit gamma/tau [Lachnospiraceae bacterium]
MAYQALYRKFRPDRFEDVKGQDAIVRTLKNQIRTDRIGHAYLFCGTRGTGKTTVAKLFAKAVNCVSRQEDGSPCGECASCKAIASGASMNVIEIDAASNNGVDNIRQIREEVAYAPTDARFKVYIIDEVHMLSIGAFNALLKTLEEPPAYVMFILATTEVNKIPVTILSRCQRYDFHRMDLDTLVSRMAELAEKEGIEAEEKALRYIARLANGSMRDSLSLLDQCAAFYMGQAISYDGALEVLGAVDTAVFSQFFRAIEKRDVNKSIHILENVLMQGRDLSAFVSDFTWYLRNVLLCGMQDEGLEDVIDVSKEALSNMKEEAAGTDLNSLMRYIRIFSELSSEIRYSTQRRALTEIALIRLMRPETDLDLTAYEQRISSLEWKIEKGVQIAPRYVDTAEEALGNSQAEIQETETEAAGIDPESIPKDIRETLSNWGRILNKLDGAQRSAIRMAIPSISDETLLILFEEEVKLQFMQDEENRKALETALREVMGRDVPFTMELKGEGANGGYPDLKGIINFDNIEIMEEEP